MKTCFVCNKSYHLDDFHKAPNSKDGRKNKCKFCCRAHYKKYRVSKRDWTNARKKEYYESNKFEIITRQIERRKRQYVVDKIAHEVEKARSRLRKKISCRSVVYSPEFGINGVELVNHLHSTFESNYGIPREFINCFDIEVDHIKPFCSAGTIKEVKKLNHFSNLQYLMKCDNISKGIKEREIFKRK